MGHATYTFADVVAQAVAAGASDVHLVERMSPLIRVNGTLTALSLEPLPLGGVESLCTGLVDADAQAELRAHGAVDLAFACEGQRLRANFFLRGGTVAACLRLIPDAIPRLAALGLPPTVNNFVDLRDGLLLVTGATGSGKSTTLAALVGAFLERSPLHVLTIEDPIEFVHTPAHGLVNQRALGADSRNFAMALRHAMRQDPDIILVGEMRDCETVRAALTLAETGHLVLSTLHSPTAIQAVRRMIDLFPVAEHGAIRAQLAEVLQVVLSQALVPALPSGRAVACELMIANTAIRSLIREDKAHHLQTQIESGQARSGMQSLAQSLLALHRAGRISTTVAAEYGILVEPSATHDPRDRSRIDRRNEQ